MAGGSQRKVLLIFAAVLAVAFLVSFVVFPGKSSTSKQAEELQAKISRLQTQLGELNEKEQANKQKEIELEMEALTLLEEIAKLKASLQHVHIQLPEQILIAAPKAVEVVHVPNPEPPTICTSPVRHVTVEPHKLAVVAAFRSERTFVTTFTNMMHTFFRDLGIKYSVLLVQQTDDKPFNRGALFNALFNITNSLYDYYCFHEIDVVPAQPYLNYTYPLLPRHLGVNLQKTGGWALPYPEFIGGAFCINNNDFIKVNGYPNDVWDYRRGENDDLFNRLQINSLAVDRPATSHWWELTVGYDELEDFPLSATRVPLEHTRGTWKTNGLSSAKYALDKQQEGEHNTIYRVRLLNDPPAGLALPPLLGNYSHIPMQTWVLALEFTMPEENLAAYLGVHVRPFVYKKATIYIADVPNRRVLEYSVLRDAYRVLANLSNHTHGIGAYRNVIMKVADVEYVFFINSQYHVPDVEMIYDALELAQRRPKFSIIGFAATKRGDWADECHEDFGVFDLQLDQSDINCPRRTLKLLPAHWKSVESAGEERQGKLLVVHYLHGHLPIIARRPYLLANLMQWDEGETIPAWEIFLRLATAVDPRTNKPLYVGYTNLIRFELRDQLESTRFADDLSELDDLLELYNVVSAETPCGQRKSPLDCSHTTQVAFDSA